MGSFGRMLKRKAHFKRCIFELKNILHHREEIIAKITQKLEADENNKELNLQLESLMGYNYLYVIKAIEHNRLYNFSTFFLTPYWDKKHDCCNKFVL